MDYVEYFSYTVQSNGAVRYFLMAVMPLVTNRDLIRSFTKIQSWRLAIPALCV